MAGPGCYLSVHASGLPAPALRLAVRSAGCRAESSGGLSGQPNVRFAKFVNKTVTKFGDQQIFTKFGDKFVTKSVTKYPGVFGSRPEGLDPKVLRHSRVSRKALIQKRYVNHAGS